MVPHDVDAISLDLTQVPDGRVLVSAQGEEQFNSMLMLEGFPPMGAKPAAKPPKKKSKRALVGGASGSSSRMSSSDGGASSSSSGPLLKRGRLGAGPDSAAESDRSCSSSEDEGAAAEAEPLV